MDNQINKNRIIIKLSLGIVFFLIMQIIFSLLLYYNFLESFKNFNRNTYSILIIAFILISLTMIVYNERKSRNLNTYEFDEKRISSIVRLLEGKDVAIESSDPMYKYISILIDYYSMGVALLSYGFILSFFKKNFVALFAFSLVVVLLVIKKIYTFLNYKK